MGTPCNLVKLGSARPLLQPGVVRSVAVVLAVLVAAARASSAGGDVHVFQSTTDHAITEGETTIEGDPAAVYAVVIDYSKWASIFPDVAKVQITSQHGCDARVTLVKPDGNKDNLHFHNQPQARMVYFEDTGNKHAEVWAEIVFAPGESAGTTRVHVRLYADVHGIASVVVSDSDVRHQREVKVQSQLAAFRDYFRKHTSSAGLARE